MAVEPTELLRIFGAALLRDPEAANWEAVTPQHVEPDTSRGDVIGPLGRERAHEEPSPRAVAVLEPAVRVVDGDPVEDLTKRLAPRG